MTLEYIPGKYNPESERAWDSYYEKLMKQEMLKGGHDLGSDSKMAEEGIKRA